MTRATRPVDFIRRQAEYLQAAGYTVSFYQDADGEEFTATAKSGQRTYTMTANLNTFTGNWKLGLATERFAGSGPYYYEGYGRIARMVVEAYEREKT